MGHAHISFQFQTGQLGPNTYHYWMQLQNLKQKNNNNAVFVFNIDYTANHRTDEKKLK